MLILFFFIIIGAVVGSFLNVCIHRLPRNESVVWPASHCPACGKQLSPWELFPIISYLILKGKCSGCREPISIRYPLVETLSAFFFVATWQFVSGDMIYFLFYLVFVLGLLVIVFIDLEHLLIPDVVSISGIVFGLLFAGFRSGEAGSLALLGESVFGGALGFLFFLVVAKLGGMWFKKEVVGEGDLYLAAFMGVYLGPVGMVVALFVAYLSAALVAIV
ncbi:MAG: prepilin peptidase, partial [Candidatus Margulisbacteria bacterium]|nr:prepilin peptidase [Candidatus Margulisiibacteriota bacterium]